MGSVPYFTFCHIDGSHPWHFSSIYVHSGFGVVYPLPSCFKAGMTHCLLVHNHHHHPPPTHDNKWIFKCRLLSFQPIGIACLMEWEQVVDGTCDDKGNCFGYNLHNIYKNTFSATGERNEKLFSYRLNADFSHELRECPPHSFDRNTVSQRTYTVSVPFNDNCDLLLPHDPNWIFLWRTFMHKQERKPGAIDVVYLKDTREKLHQGLLHSSSSLLLQDQGLWAYKGHLFL